MNDHSLHCGVTGVSQPSIEARLSLARQTCEQHGWRMTPLREQVFEIVLRSATPIGAYDILAQLQQRLTDTTTAKTKPAKPIAPPTVYRSLDFLIEHGFVHQLNSANAFIPCCHPREQHIAAFLICQQCHKVEEFSANSIGQMLTSVVEQADFAIHSSVIEILGVCATCQLPK